MGWASLTLLMTVYSVDALMVMWNVVKDLVSLTRAVAMATDSIEMEIGSQKIQIPAWCAPVGTELFSVQGQNVLWPPVLIQSEASVVMSVVIVTMATENTEMVRDLLMIVRSVHALVAVWGVQRSPVPLLLVQTQSFRTVALPVGTVRSKVAEYRMEMWSLISEILVGLVGVR